MRLRYASFALAGVLLTCCLSALPRAAAAPQREPQTSGVIRVSSNLVTVPVSVIDQSGEPVRNLVVSDFRLEEEGKPRQVVSLGEPGKTPLDLALLFDVSGSVHERFKFEQQAAASFLRLVLRPIDAVSVFSIGVGPRLVLARTPSLASAINSVMAMAATREATAFFDAVVEASRYLGSNPSPGTRRVLLVLSDGEDNYSRARLEDAMRELQRHDSLFYSINPSGPAIQLNRISVRGQNAMASLAAETGGAFLPATSEDLERVFRQIAAELQAQYLLGFYAGDEHSAGEFRRIAVRIPSHPELRVRARRGYYAPKG